VFATAIVKELGPVEPNMMLVWLRTDYMTMGFLRGAVCSRSSSAIRNLTAVVCSSPCQSVSLRWKNM
jgi:hypothetical protein